MHYIKSCPPVAKGRKQYFQGVVLNAQCWILFHFILVSMMIPPIDHERLLYTEERIQGIIGIMILLRKLPIEVEVLD